MVPILSSIIVGQQPTRPRAFLLSASYVLGMAVTYAAVGVLMGLFGAGLNLQAQLQSAPVLITFAVLFSVFGLAMLGAFDLRLSPRLAQRVDAWQARAQRSGPPGLALAGALSVLVVSPCVTAPLAGALVIISTTGDALTGGAMLFSLGMGMGVPLLLVGTFGATLLPRSGPGSTASRSPLACCCSALPSGWWNAWYRGRSRCCSGQPWPLAPHWHWVPCRPTRLPAGQKRARRWAWCC